MQYNRTSMDTRKEIIFYRSVIAILIVIIFVLCGLLVKDRIFIKTTKLENEQHKQELQSELDSLVSEHAKVKAIYNVTSTNLKQKDSIILANAEEIRSLIFVKADYKRVKRKLELLRKLSQTYIYQIDSLYKINSELREENRQIKNNYTHEQQKNADISKNRDELANKINKAALLKAYDISATAIKVKTGNREEKTAKYKKTDKISVHFTLCENTLILPGRKSIYIRIARPDNKILVKNLTNDNSFTYNGELLQYSIRYDVNYENQAMDITAYWTNHSPGQLIAGTYVLTIFEEDNVIGETSFSLK